MQLRFAGILREWTEQRTDRNIVPMWDLERTQIYTTSQKLIRKWSRIHCVDGARQAAATNQCVYVHGSASSLEGNILALSNSLISTPLKELQVELSSIPRRLLSLHPGTPYWRASVQGAGAPSGLATELLSPQPVPVGCQAEVWLGCLGHLGL